MRPSRNPELIAALGIEVKTRRAELELTQEDLAGRMGIDRPFISLIEVGRKQPTISVLYSLCGALEVPFAELASRVEARYKKALRMGARSRAAKTPTGKTASKRS